MRSRLLTEAGFLHAFPERTAADGELARALGVGAIRQVKQVHGSDALEVGDEGDAAAPAEADALVARAGARPFAIGIRVADCVPILVADEASGAVAAIHAGWRGVTRGVVRAAVERLGGRGHLVAAIGPCIGECCFEVGRDVAEQIALAAPGARIIASQATAAGEGAQAKAHVDLRAAVRAQLVAAGVESARIEDVPGCTKHEAGRFHSYRRDGAHSGRMLAAIATRTPA